MLLDVVLRVAGGGAARLALYAVPGAHFLGATYTSRAREAVPLLLAMDDMWRGVYQTAPVLAAMRTEAHADIGVVTRVR